MAISPFGATATGIPGGVGGGVLGLGVVLALHDQFSKQANLAKAQLAGLSAATDKYTMRMNRNLVQLQASLAGLAVGIATLAAVSFPVRSAISFEAAIQRVRVVAGDDMPLADLETMAIELAAMFPQDATEMANALRITIAAGIRDIPKARRLLESTNKLAVATQSSLQQTIHGMTSFVNAYQLGLDDVFSEEQAAAMFDELASALLETIKHGKFSASPHLTDIEQMSKFFGQIAPTASGLGMSIPELLAVWSTATLGGQDARRSATGIRQALMDLNNRFRQLSGWEGFREMAGRSGYDYDFSRGDLPGFVQTHGFMPLLDLVSDYATYDLDEHGRQRLEQLLSTERMQQNIEIIHATLPEDMTVEEALRESEAARDLVEGLRKAGMVDITKLNEVFRSIWGLTATLPLVGVQRERRWTTYEAILKAMGESEIDRGFLAMMNTVMKQWELFTSRLETVRILWGKTMLPSIQQFLKFLNIGTQIMVELSDRFEAIVAIIMQVATGAALFMSAFFGVLAVSKGLSLMSMAFRAWMRELRWFPRYVRGGLLLMFKDIIAAMALVVAATLALRKAWDLDFMGMQTTLTIFWKRVTTIVDLLILLFKRIDDEGLSYLTEAEFQRLLDAGIDPQTLVNIFGLLFRLQRAVEGFRRGFLSFFESITESFQLIKGTVFEPLLDIFDAISDFIREIIEPGWENVTAWEAWGVRVGYVAGVLVTVFGSLLLVNTTLRTITAMLGMWRPMLVMLGGLIASPFFLGLSAAAAAMYGLYRYLGKDRIEAFYDYLRDPDTLRRFDTRRFQWMHALSFLWSNLDLFGLEHVLKRTFDMLDVFDLFSDEYRAHVAKTITDLHEVWTSIEDPLGFKHALKQSFEILTGHVWDDFYNAVKGALTERYERLRDIWRGVEDPLGIGPAFAQSFEVITGLDWEPIATAIKTNARRAGAYIIELLPESVVAFLESQFNRLRGFLESFWSGIHDALEHYGTSETLRAVSGFLPNLLESILNFLRGLDEEADVLGLAKLLGERLVFLIHQVTGAVSPDMADTWTELGRRLGWAFRRLAAAADLVLIALTDLLTFNFGDLRKHFQQWADDHGLGQIEAGFIAAGIAIAGFVFAAHGLYRIASVFGPAFMLIGGLTHAWPILATGAATIAALTLAYNDNVFGLRDWVDGLREAFEEGGVQGAIGYFIESVQPLIDRITALFEGLKAAVLAAFEGLKAGIGSDSMVIFKTINDTFDILLGHLETIAGEEFQNVWQAAGYGVGRALRYLTAGIDLLLRALNRLLEFDFKGLRAAFDEWGDEHALGNTERALVAIAAAAFTLGPALTILKAGLGAVTGAGKVIAHVGGAASSAVKGLLPYLWRMKWWIGGLTAAYEANLLGVKDWVAGIVDAYKDGGLIGAFKYVIEWAERTLEPLFGAIEAFIGGFAEAGVWDSVVEVFKSAVNVIERLGEHAETLLDRLDFTLNHEVFRSIGIISGNITKLVVAFTGGVLDYLEWLLDPNRGSFADLFDKWMDKHGIDEVLERLKDQFLEMWNSLENWFQINLENTRFGEWLRSVGSAIQTYIIGPITTALSKLAELEQQFNLIDRFHPLRDIVETLTLPAPPRDDSAGIVPGTGELMPYALAEDMVNTLAAESDAFMLALARKWRGGEDGTIPEETIERLIAVVDRLASEDPELTVFAQFDPADFAKALRVLASRSARLQGSSP